MNLCSSDGQATEASLKQEKSIFNLIFSDRKKKPFIITKKLNKNKEKNIVKMNITLIFHFIFWFLYTN